MKNIRAGILSMLVLFVATRADASIILYDGTQAGLPQSQGWLAYQSSLHTATTTLSVGGSGPVTLDTTANGSNSEYAGFSNFAATGSLVNRAFPTLSPATGFDLTFDMKLDSESHSGSTDRAGLSVLLLGSNLSGVELGFWDGQIWAQSASPIFTHSAEQETGVDPASGFHQYDLHIQGSTYTLTADGSQILTGPTRNYTANSLAFPLNVPYLTPDFVFLGDDTSSAQAVSEIQSVAISVPEPAAGFLVLGVILHQLVKSRARNVLTQ